MEYLSPDWIVPVFSYLTFERFRKKPSWRHTNDLFENVSNEKQAIHQAICSVIANSIPGNGFSSLIIELINGWVARNSVTTEVDLLPFYICDSEHCERNRVLPVATAWLLLRLAAKSFDDIEDGDVKAGIGETTNLASGLLVSAYQVLTVLGGQVNLSSKNFQRIMKELNRAILRACEGQYLDLSAKQESLYMNPEEWLKIASAKSGDIFGWGAWASAFILSEDTRKIENYREYGFYLGILMQVADDFNDFYFSNSPDLSQGKITLPVSYALYVANIDEHTRLEKLLRDASLGNDEAEKNARQLVVRLGAIRYLISVAWMQRQQALNAISLTGHTPSLDHPLVSLLNKIMSTFVQRIDQLC